MNATKDARPILLTFCDDSTLIFALRMRDLLRQAEPDINIKMVWYGGENALSHRQMEQFLPEGPDMSIIRRDFRLLLESDHYRALITSRIYRPLTDALKDPVVKQIKGRPAVIAFLGGLDFFPELGYARRINCDGVFLFPQTDIAVFKETVQNPSGLWQEIGFGHPAFLQPEPKNNDKRDIYFFTQALSPSTKRGRIHMIRAMAAMARRNPDRTVWIKLRHLPGENAAHLHLEKYDYPGLMDEMDDLPENLKLTACTMDEALANAGLGITCTSTAAIDVIREGVPCMVHLDFVDNYVDPLVPPMRKLFAQSGVITSLEDMLNLRAADPDPTWLENMLCPRDLGARTLEMIDSFHVRPFQTAQDPDLEYLRQATLERNQKQ